MTYTCDPDVDTSAIRMIDLEKKFHLGPYELAERLMFQGVRPLPEAAPWAGRR
jgi:hypothetical protein